MGEAHSALLADEAYSFSNMARVGIALFDQAHGQPMGAEDELNARAIRKVAKYFSYVGGESLDVERMIVEVLDAALGKIVVGLAVDATPFFEAAERGGIRIVRVEREEDEFVEAAGLFEGGDGVCCEWFPIAHGSDGQGINIGLQSGDKFRALALGEDANGRAAADHGVAPGDGDAALLGDVTGERAANEIDRAERNDVRVEKEIAEEGLDVIEGIRSAQLEQNDAHALLWVVAHEYFPFFGREEIGLQCEMKRQLKNKIMYSRTEDRPL